MGKETLLTKIIKLKLCVQQTPENLHNFILLLSIISLEIKILNDRVCFPKDQKRMVKDSSLPKIDFSRVQVVGRDKDLQNLENTYQKKTLQEKSCHAIFVSGYSGSGKTTLVDAFQRKVAPKTKSSNVEEQKKRSSLFCRGKFDQFSKLTAFSALVDALEELCESLSPIMTAEMKITIYESLGNDVSVLSKFLKNFDVLMEVADPQLDPKPQQKSKDISKKIERISEFGDVNGFNRLKIVLQTFLGVLSSFHSIVIVLDDLQWSDGSTLDLVQFLLDDNTQDGTSCSDDMRLLIVGCYRDNEVDSEHYLALKMSQLRLGSYTEIPIGDLTSEDINMMVSQILKLDKDEVKVLSEVIYRKTSANPFFVLQFLDLLQKQNLLRYSIMDFKWQWDIDEIRSETNLTNNVVEIVGANIKKLDVTTQEALKIAACLGARFDSKVVEKVLMKMGLFATVDDSDSLISKSFLIAEQEQFLDRDVSQESVYRFSHDRIQQASYQLIAGNDTFTLDNVKELSSEHIQLHRTIGSVLLDMYKYASAPISWHLLVGAEQLNLSRSLILDNETEKIELAKINLQAAELVQKKSAFFASAEFLRTAVELLGPNRWTSNYELSAKVLSRLASMEYCCGHVSKSHKANDEVLSNATNMEDKYDAFVLRSNLLASEYRHAENIAFVAQTVNELGIKMHTKFNLLKMVMAVGKTNGNLKKFTDDEIVGLKFIDDKWVNTITTLLYHGHTSAWFGNFLYANVGISSVLVNVLLEFGLSPLSPMIIVLWAVTSCCTGDINQAKQMADIAYRIYERLSDQDKGKTSMFLVLYGGFVQHLFRPLAQVVQYGALQYKLLMSSGEVSTATVAAMVTVKMRFWLAHPLPTLAIDIKRVHEEMIDYETNFGVANMALYRQMIENLMQQKHQPALLQGSIIPDFDSFCKSTGEKLVGQVKVEVAFIGMVTAFFFGDIDMAVGHAKTLLKLEGTEFPLFYSLWYPFFRGMTWLELVRSGKKKYMRHAKRELAKLSTWVKNGFVNILSNKLLLTAEVASIVAIKKSKKEGLKPALDAYDKAILTASRSGFSLFAAIANERAANFCYACNQKQDAVHYLERCILLLQEWGADGLVASVASRYEMENSTSNLTRSLDGSFLTNRAKLDEEVTSQHKKKDWVKRASSIVVRPSFGSS